MLYEVVIHHTYKWWKAFFFCLVGRKYHFRSQRPIANVVFSASLDKKIVY